MRNALRIPDHRIFEPQRRVDGLVPGFAAPVGVTTLEVLDRGVLVFEEAVVKTHDRECELEGGGGGHALVALAFVQDGLAGGGIGHDRADRVLGVGKGGKRGQQGAGGGVAEFHHRSTSVWGEYK